MPTALIKITQGATTDIPGNAVLGSKFGGDVVFSNGDDTDVVNWKWELVYTPPGSGVNLDTQDGPVDTYTMTDPDKPGCYRMKLTVTDEAGIEDVDMRNFGIPFPNVGYIAPPYQGNPRPLPLTGQGAKPDEMNFGGGSLGWDGNEQGTHKLLYFLMSQVDADGLVLAPDVQTTDNVQTELYSIPSGTLQDGAYIIEIKLLARDYPFGTNAASFHAEALFTVTGGAATGQGAEPYYPDMKTGGAAAWALDFDDTGGDLRLLVTGALGTTILWRPRIKIIKSADVE